MTSLLKNINQTARTYKDVSPEPLISHSNLNMRFEPTENSNPEIHTSFQLSNNLRYPGQSAGLLLLGAFEKVAY